MSKNNIKPSVYYCNNCCITYSSDVVLRKKKLSFLSKLKNLQRWMPIFTFIATVVIGVIANEIADTQSQRAKLEASAEAIKMINSDLIKNNPRIADFYADELKLTLPELAKRFKVIVKDEIRLQQELMKITIDIAKKLNEGEVVNEVVSYCTIKPSPSNKMLKYTTECSSTTIDNISKLPVEHFHFIVPNRLIRPDILRKN